MSSITSSPLRRVLAIATFAVVAVALAVAVQMAGNKAGQAGVRAAEGEGRTSLAAVSTGGGGSSTSPNANKRR